MATEAPEGSGSEDDKPQPPSETVLEEQLDPDQAVFAEQAIHHYVTWVLDPVREAVIDALDRFTAHLSSMADETSFDSRPFLEELGASALGEVVKLFGGAKTPIGHVIHRELEGAIDSAARSESQAHVFLSEVGSAVRDACWFVRDNLQAILANHWDHVRDLAYEGSTEFIPALHHLGLPHVEADTTKLVHGLTKCASHYQKSLPRKKEEAEKDVPDANAAPKETSEKAQQLFDEEEGQKQAM